MAPESPRNIKRLMDTMRKYHIMIATLIVFCDRMTKWLVAQKITLHDSIDIVPECSA